jgi:hypothetical protein
VSIDVNNAPLREALGSLFAGTSFQYAVEPAVPNYPITLSIRDVPYDTALHTLLRLAPGVTYRKEGDVYVIGMKPTAGAAARLMGPVVELELPGGTAEKLTIEGDHMVKSGTGLEVSGSVRMRFANGVLLHSENARVRVENDKATGTTRIRVEPAARAPAP